MADPGPNAELRRFKESHEAAKARLRKLVQVGHLLTLAFVIVLVGFLAALYDKVTAMYSPASFEGPLQREALNMLPKLEPQLRLLWSETAPVYGEMALQQFQEALPEVQEASSREFDKLRTSLVENAETQVQAALDRIARDQERRLKQHFPRLSTPEGAEALGLNWTEAVQQDLEGVILHFHGRYSEDLGELQATLEQFRSEELEAMPEDELTRQFVHLWLMKLDHMVMLEDGGGPDHD